MRHRRWLSLLVVGLMVLSGLGLVGAPSVGGQSPPEQCFPETAKCVRGPFLRYWLEHGGLAINGFPLTDPISERLDDGQEHIVQYFERVRMEEHPANQPPYDILLGQFGRLLYLTDPGLPQANRAPRREGTTYFDETGHNVGSRFMAYWTANGGLPQFGYPISEELGEVLEDGQLHTVQYFERARFEHHPNLPPPYDVLLGQFGRRILAAQNPNAPLPFLISGGRGTLYRTDQPIRIRLGQPLAAEATIGGVVQPFERGTMIWRQDQRRIYVLAKDTDYWQPIGGWLGFSDTWEEGQEPGGGPAPVPNLFFPKRGFGKVWRENPQVQQMLGYALSADESIKSLVTQPFAGGLLLDVREAPAQGDYRYSQGIYLLYGNGRFEFRWSHGP